MLHDDGSGHPARAPDKGVWATTYLEFIWLYWTEGEQMLSLKRSRLVILSLMVSGALFLAAPAFAQTLATFTTNASGVFTGTVTIPAGTAPGIYDLSATGLGPATSPYPPTSTGSLSVSQTVVVAGQSITVQGSGYAANTPVVVSLSFVASAANQLQIAQTNTVRTLTARIRVVAPGAPTGNVGGNITINNNASCTSDAKATAASSYAIAQAGGSIINNNNSVTCRSEATATGVAQKIENTPVTKPVTKVLARTGVDALPLLAAALATILLGSVLLSAGRRRGRFEGSVSSA